MKSAFRSLQIFLLLCGVFGADELKSVIEGDSVTLHNDLTQIEKFYLLEWKFGDSVIARTNGKHISYPSPTEIFRDRLQLDETGSLTIKNMKTRLSGLYELQISHSAGTSESKFNVTVYESPSEAGKAGKADVKSLSVKEGAPVTLQTDVTQLDGDELIVWRFGDEGRLIAKADIEAKSSPLYDDERFRGRLELDQTGSLNITNTRTTDSGFYTVKISSKKQTSYQRFSVTVSEPGLSAAAVAGIVIAVLAAAAAAAIYHRRKISELIKQKSSVTVSVSEGEDIPLKPNNKINKGDEMKWMFGEGDQLTPIAEIRGETGKIFTYDDNADGRFRGRLMPDKTTGSLTIRNSRAAHSGLYTLHIMTRSGTSVQIFFVTVNEKVEVKPVEYGGSVTLKPDTEIQRDEQMLWMFGEQDDLIAQVKAGTLEMYDDDAAGEIFRGRLELDEKTGSLTITDITPEHSGLYKLQISSSSRGILIKKFMVSIPLRIVIMTVGKPVHLKTDHPKIERDDVIEWRFGAENSLIAEVRGGTGETHDGSGGRFRGRLQLNDQTGDLTILNSAAEHAGYYNLKIRSSKGDTIMTYSVIKERGTSLDASSGRKVKKSEPMKRVNKSETVEMALLNK